jgi:hypothetical protein
MKYFICVRCGELKNSKDIDNDLAVGGSGNCYCNFSVDQWDKVSNSFQPVCFRILEPFVEIPKYIYRRLREESNNILRMGMYNSWKMATSPNFPKGS